jgi:hypothetical protein
MNLSLLIYLYKSRGLLDKLDKWKYDIYTEL